ncbi:MAG: ABC transporter substrate-binding protein [Deltaproteobacteria bacterium]|nr:ABC transporter substrate-binding protein [Deltaproteobacteria bacterium]
MPPVRSGSGGGPAGRHLLGPGDNLDFQLVFVASSAFVTAAMLGGDAEISLLGGIGIVRAFVQGATDLAFIAGVKNVMTQSIIARPEIKRVEDLKGKKIAVSRVGGNTHYFSVQVLRRYGMDAAKDVTFIQTGGEFEALAAFANRAVDAATMTPPADYQAVSQGGHRLAYGPELGIPYAATIFAARRSVIAKKPKVIGNFVRAMAEASKILHTDKEFAYKVLGKELRVNDRKILDAAYNAEITALERRLDIKTESLQAILDEVSQIDPRAKKVKPQDLVDRRYLDDMEQGGFFNKLWGERR